MRKAGGNFQVVNALKQTIKIYQSFFEHVSNFMFWKKTLNFFQV